MALPSFPTCQDNYHFGWNTRLKVPASSYTAPKVGDLVTYSTGAANECTGPADEGLPVAIVESINSGNGLLSVTELVAGGLIELPYSGSLALGDKIEMAGSTQGTSLLRTIVSVENSDGVGLVIAVDAGAPHGTGHAVVRFS